MEVNLAMYSMDSKSQIASFLHPVSQKKKHNVGKPHRTLKAAHSTLRTTALASILGDSEDC